MRTLYGWMLKLHPRQFRERFEMEMLASFDDATAHGFSSAARLVVDACVSLVRQWGLRPGARKTAAAVADGGIPVFHQFEDYRLRRVALMQGFVLALGLFGVLTALLSHGPRMPATLLGSKHMSPRALSFARESLLPSEPTTKVAVPAAQQDELRVFAEAYFRYLLILRHLDRNHDYRLSAREIEAAPAVLPELDLDGDGSISAEEAGFCCLGNQVPIEPVRAPRGLIEPPRDVREHRMPSPYEMERHRREFMHLNPVYDVLDADRDLKISGAEMRNAAAALRSLDLTGDGELGTIEIVPDEEAWKILGGPRR